MLYVIQLNANTRLFAEGGRRIHFKSPKRLNDGMLQELERVRDRKMDLLCINVDIFIDVGMEWYTKSFDDCILDEDPECAFNSSEYTFSRAIPYFCGQDPRCLY